MAQNKQGRSACKLSSKAEKTDTLDAKRVDGGYKRIDAPPNCVDTSRNRADAPRKLIEWLRKRVEGPRKQVVATLKPADG